MLSRFALTPVVVACLVSVAHSAETGYARPDLLVEASDLARPDVAEKFVILDARKEPVFLEERVPGARWVDHETWKTAFDGGTDLEGWSERIGALGIDTGSKVVVYDDVSTRDAARIWWILRYFGVRDVRVLNGGWKAWKVGGLPTTGGEVSPPEAAEFTAAPRRKRLVTKDQILRSLPGDSLQIVDARSEDEFCGIDVKEDQRGGAIPGARHLEWSDLLDPKTDRFREPAEMQRLFEQAGIDLRRPTASHCASGGRASVMAFALELMGAEDSRNYYPGWSEWGSLEDVPIETPEKLAQ